MYLKLTDRCLIYLTLFSTSESFIQSKRLPSPLPSLFSDIVSLSQNLGIYLRVSNESIVLNLFYSLYIH